MLTLVRHARTAANAEGRLQGRLDLPLDEVGREQAQALPHVVHSVDRVICSPMLRARETARVFGLEPTIDDRWQEVGYGDYEGTRMADVPPPIWHQWLTDLEFTPPGGESLRAMGKRVFAACDELAEEARTSHIVVVSHAMPVKAAMAWALGAGLEITLRSHVDQGSVTRVLMRDRGPALSVFNLVPY